MTDTAAPLDTPQPAHPVPVLPAPPVVPATVVAPTDEVPWDGRPPVRTERWWTLSILVSMWIAWVRSQVKDFISLPKTI